uniref:Uncharacterized protein n=1 Tax=Rhizophora mucronata TaxID=61149 RepID=A0A2P2QAJ4_RHIMU
MFYMFDFLWVHRFWVLESEEKKRYPLVVKPCLCLFIEETARRIHLLRYEISSPKGLPDKRRLAGLASGPFG